MIASRAREHIKDDHDVNTNIFEKRQPQTPASVFVCVCQTGRSDLMTTGGP